jgi:hypothetical protein
MRDALHAKAYDVLHRVLRIDPTYAYAQNSLGFMYHQGKGVQQDYKQAAAWLRKVAEQGHAIAQCSLGRIQPSPPPPPTPALHRRGSYVPLQGPFLTAN